MNLKKYESGRLALALDTAEDRVSAYMVKKIDRDQLRDNDVELMERWISIWHRQLEMKSANQAVKEHHSHYNEGNRSLSLRSAWNDWKRANNVFGNINATNQKARWVLLFEYQMAKLPHLNDREFNKGLKNLIEINKNLIDEGNGDEPPALIININLPKSGHRSINLNDFSNIPEAELADVIQQMDSEVKSDEEIKQLLDGSAG